MSANECPFPECEFKVDDGVSEERKTTLLKIHLVYHQSQLASSSAKPEKIKRPSISVGSSTEDWVYFQSRWSTYKNATKLSGQDVMVQMLECCDDVLRRDLSRVYKNAIIKMDERELLCAIKKLAVLDENTLVSRYKLHNLKQDLDEPIRSYAARVKGQAHVCKLFLPCPECQFADRKSVV